MQENKFVGPFETIDPSKVRKLALVIDDYKKPKLQSLWAEAETKAAAQLPGFDPGEKFHEELKRDPIKRLIYSFRYYTPKDNYKLKEGVQ